VSRPPPARRPPSEPWSASCLALVYGLFTLALAGGLLLPGRSLFRWDTLLYTWPGIVEARALLWSGRFPFWTDAWLCGADLLGNANLGLLYPPRLLNWVLPLRPGAHLFLFLHVFGSLAAMHLFLQRGLKLSNLASFVGAAAWGTSGVARALWDSINIAPLPWIPLGLLALTAPGAVRRPRRTAAAGLCFAMLVLGGDLQAAAAWGGVALAYSLAAERPGDRVRTWGAALLLGLALSAAQWLPSFFVWLESARAAGLPLSEILERSLSPARMIEWLAPHAFGSHTEWFGAALAGQGAQKTAPWFGSIHIGVIPFLFAFFALAKRGDRIVRWAFFIAASFLLLSFGRFLPGAETLFRAPLLSGFRYPEKHALWTAFGLSVLAGIGVSAARDILPRLARGKTALLAAASLALPFAGVAAAVILLERIAPDMPLADHVRALWIRAAAFGLLAAAFLLFLRRGQTVVCGILLVAAALPAWYAETPVTQRWNPLETPAAVAAARTARAVDQGRLLVDPSLDAAPLPSAWPAWPASLRSASFPVHRGDFNSPALWGVPTARGFSPFESAASRAFQERLGDPDIAPDSLVDFARATGARFVLTDRPDAVRSAGGGEWIPRRAWGDPQAIALLERPSASLLDAGGPAVLWRSAPGEFRLAPRGASGPMRIRQTWSPGWRAETSEGRRVAVRPDDDSPFLVCEVPEGAAAVFLRYRPRGWLAGAALSLAALAGLAARFPSASRGSPRRLPRRPIVIFGTAALVMIALSLGIRSRWSTTFDEGFHLARGLGLVRHGDSRLSYFHPPLQNLLGGYAAELAWGHALRDGSESAWKQAEVQGYATGLAARNGPLFPLAVQASRWSALSFSLLGLLFLVLFASQAGGPLAAWLAAVGWCANPLLLAHGNLNTSDMGVTSLCLGGVWLLWLHSRGGALRHLLYAGALFALSATVKFSGLVFLAGWMAAAAWILCRERRFAAALLLPAAGALFLAGLLWLLYGPEPQVIRTPIESPLNGVLLPAGRYVEGLFRQGGHALLGHKMWWAGERLQQAQWFHLPLMFLLKMPSAWVLALALLSPFAWRGAERGRMLPVLIPPALFLVLLLTANRLALGARYLLPLIPFALLVPAVGLARLRRAAVRHAAAFLLGAASVLTAVRGAPVAIQHCAVWAGGAGHEWTADSNYDWGQDLPALERHWDSLTAAHGGRPLRLLYYGFEDPRLSRGLTVSQPSACGFTDWQRVLSGEPSRLASWRADLARATSPVVASLSFQRLEPMSFPAASLAHTNRLTDCFELLY